MIEPLIPITRKQALLFAGFLVLYEFLVYIANDMIMPGMLSVIHTFHAPKSAVATSLTAYILGGASLQLLLGPISDRYGRRPVMLFGVAWFVVATLMIPWAQTITQFLIVRFLEGMGLCYINVVGYALLQEIFNEKDAIRMVAVMVNVAILAPLFGPLAGAEFLELGMGGWHAIFYWISGLSVVALLGLYYTMPESVGQMKRDGQIIRRQALTIATILHNYQTLLTHRVFVFGTLAYGLMGMICIIWIALSPVILITLSKCTLVQYGLWQLPVFGAFILGNIILSNLTKYYKVVQLSLIGSLSVFAGSLLLCGIPWLAGYTAKGMMPGLVVYSIGYGLGATALNRFILFVTQVSTGTTSALLFTVSLCFQAFGNEIGNYVFTRYDLKTLIYYLGLIGMLHIVCVAVSLYHHQRTQVLGLEHL